MKNKIVFEVLFILGLSISACSNSINSNKESSSSSNTSSSSLSSSQSKSASFSYDFPKKEEGLSLEAIEEAIDKIDPKPEERKLDILGTS